MIFRRSNLLFFSSSIKPRSQTIITHLFYLSFLCPIHARYVKVRFNLGVFGLQIFLIRVKTVFLIYLLFILFISHNIYINKFHVYLHPNKQTLKNNFTLTSTSTSISIEIISLLTNGPLVTDYILFFNFNLYLKNIENVQNFKGIYNYKNIFKYIVYNFLFRY